MKQFGVVHRATAKGGTSTYWVRRFRALMRIAAILLVMAAILNPPKTPLDFSPWLMGSVSHNASAIPAGNPTTSFTVTIPAGVLTDDVLFLIVAHKAAGVPSSVTDNDAGGNTWTNITAASSGSTNLSLWWKRATSGTASKTVTVSGLTNCGAGVLSAYSGALVSGTPYENVGGEANASGDEANAGTTPTADGSEVCLAVGNLSNDLAVTSPSTTDPGALNIRGEKLSTGGTD